jgi:ABC-type amino acid transport substrate-binding protein
MRPQLKPWLAAALLIATIGRSAAGQPPLRVCLSDDIPLYSVHHGAVASGFDLAVAGAVAKRLERPLVLQWFENKRDESTNMALGANALLSAALCDLVGGFPLIKDALDRPGLETARLPDYEGAGRSDRMRRVKLGTLVATRPYHRAPLTVVLGPATATTRISSLADLTGLGIGVEEGSFADVVLMLFDNGKLVDRITHVVPGRGTLLPGLENGDYDTVFVDLRRLDAYRALHPDTRLTASGYYYRIGFNIGLVGLTTDMALIGQVDMAIDNLLATGELPALARAEGLTYVLPAQPAVLAPPPLTALRD